MIRINKSRAAAAMISLLLAAAPMGALAAETAALAPGAQGEPTRVGETIQRFDSKRSYLGVSASDKWLLQARIGGLMLNLRLFTQAGESVTFQENLSAATTGGSDIRLTMAASNWDEELMLQMDQGAMNVLERVGVTEIVVADHNMAVRATYSLSDLQAIRDHFGLTRGEQLCVSGEENPVTVVSEDGVRYQLTK